MQQYSNIQDLPASSANVPIQQFQLLQQQRSPGFGGYGTTFIAPHPSLMYATRDVAFYPSTLAASDYNLPYTVQQPEKQIPVSAAEPPASKAEPAPPPPKAPRTSKKSSDKSGSTYASRHQAAESRRRQRINDRCGVFLPSITSIQRCSLCSDGVHVQVDMLLTCCHHTCMHICCWEVSFQALGGVFAMNVFA